MKNKTLPKELKHLVGDVISALGQAVKAEYGEKVYKLIEDTRMDYSKLRKKSDKSLLNFHLELKNKLDKQSPEHRLQMAHAFASALELINACENAYRNQRLKQKAEKNVISGDPVVFVLTAHPTEARSAKVIDLLGELTGIIEAQLSQPGVDNKLRTEKLNFLIQLLLKIPIAKSRKPSVEDEAEYVYRSIFQPEILERLVALYASDSPCWIRSWVGGDKDGHPGVDEKVMLKSLELSRKPIIETLDQQIELSLKKLQMLPLESQPEHIDLKSELRALGQSLRYLKKIENNDYLKVNQIKSDLLALQKSFQKSMLASCPYLEFVRKTLELFPGLVVPLELREDSEVVRQAIEDKSLAIAKMLQVIKDLGGSKSAHYYARGLVLSMCESFEDFEAGCKLQRDIFDSLSIPVIPLFETKNALLNSKKIAEQIVSKPTIRKTIDNRWSKKVEIMLGYSDSAKESGAFYSRFMIQKTLRDLDSLFKKEDLTPIYFHGSGGSVARGGGSIEEQVSWWPKSAQRRFKATIQGEMIYRTFSSPELLERKVEKIRLAYKAKKTKPESSADLKVLENFAEAVREKYSSRVSDDNFLEVVEKATPYPYLDKLRIGSRPSKRSKGKLSLSSLRAIPWVLCWTQTRNLFPVWWGLGSVWKEMNNSEKARLSRAFKNSSLARSFVKTLSYAIAKIDLSVWDFYLSSSTLEEPAKQLSSKEFRQELKLCNQFLREISSNRFEHQVQPWLLESIELRSTFIYPLNVLEVIALDTKHEELLRECVTGVASGMLTTG